MKRKKKEEKQVVFYWEEGNEMWAIKDDKGLMKGWVRTGWSFENALREAQAFLPYYKDCYYGHPVQFVIHESVFEKDMGR